MAELTPWERMGLPAGFTPTPLQYNFAKLSVSTPTGPQTVHVLIVNTIAGRHGFAFSPDDFRTLANKIIEQCSGLQIASSVPSNGQHLDDPGGRV